MPSTILGPLEYASENKTIQIKQPHLPGAQILMGRHTINKTDLFRPLNLGIFNRVSGLFHVLKVLLPVNKKLKGKCSFHIQFEAPISFLLQPAHIRHLQKGEER